MGEGVKKCPGRQKKLARGRRGGFNSCAPPPGFGGVLGDFPAPGKIGSVNKKNRESRGEGENPPLRPPPGPRCRLKKTGGPARGGAGGGAPGGRGSPQDAFQPPHISLREQLCGRQRQKGRCVFTP